MLPSAATRVSDRLLFPVHTEPRSPATTLKSCSAVGGSASEVSVVRLRRSRPEFVPTQTLPSLSINTFHAALELSPCSVVKLSLGEASISWGVCHRSACSNRRIPLSLTTQREPSFPNVKSPK